MGLSTAEGAGASGLILNGLGDVQAGNAEANADKYNATIFGQNAQQELENASFVAQAGEINAAASEQKTRAELGSIKANQGASGITIGTGSSANVQASAAQVGMLDAMTIRSNAARAAYGHQVGSVNEAARAELLKSEAKNAKQAGYMGAATTVLGGAARGIQTGMFRDPWAVYQAGKGMQGPTTSGATLDTAWVGG